MLHTDTRKLSNLISQRTKSALATKKRAGVRLGRPIGQRKSKIDQYREETIELLALGVTIKRVAARLGTTAGNLRHWLKKQGLGLARTNGR